MSKRSYLEGRMIDGVFCRFGGGCPCKQCVEKIPNDGFYHAMKSEREAADATRRELDRWIALKVENLPTVLRGETIAQYRARVGERSVAFDDEASAGSRPGAPRPFSPEQLAEISRVRAEALARRLDEANEA